MFADGKSDLRKMLLDAWNELMRARGEPLRFKSRNGGFNWIVEFAGLDEDGCESFMVVLCNTEVEGRLLVEEAKMNTRIVLLRSLRAVNGPYRRLDQENLGLRISATDIRERLIS